MAGAPSRKIFRQAALDRLSSPDQLDQFVTITDARGWLALSTTIGLIVAIIVWSIVGRVPDQVAGQGILVGAGGRVADVTSAAAGRVAQIRVAVDDIVEAGDEIIDIDQPAIDEAIASAKQSLAGARRERDLLVQSLNAEAISFETNARQQIVLQRQVIEATRKRVTYLADMLEKQQALAASGVITRDQLERIRDDYERARQEVSAAQIRILELESAGLSLESERARELNRADQRVLNAERSVEELVTQLERASSITAPASGRVTEIKTFAGDNVRAGQSLISIAIANSELEAVVYVPTEDGKRVRPGMIVRVEPSTVRKEEHGTILGEVTAVSDFPVTRDGMLAILQNETLVRAFSAEGAPYTARVALKHDQSTPSGLKWTSATGPDIDITSGTTVEAEVTVRERRPIDLIIPFVRRHTGIGFPGGEEP